MSNVLSKVRKISVRSFLTYVVSAQPVIIFFDLTHQNTYVSFHIQQTFRLDVLGYMNNSIHYLCNLPLLKDGWQKPRVNSLRKVEVMKVIVRLGLEPLRIHRTQAHTLVDYELFKFNLIKTNKLYNKVVCICRCSVCNNCKWRF